MYPPPPLTLHPPHLTQVLADLPDVLLAPEDAATKFRELLMEVCEVLGKIFIFPRPILFCHQGSLLKILSTTVLVVREGAGMVKALAHGRGQAIDLLPQWFDFSH